MLHVLKYGRLHGRGVGFQRPDAGFLDFVLSRHFSRNLACDLRAGIFELRSSFFCLVGAARLTRSSWNNGSRSPVSWQNLEEGSIGTQRGQHHAVRIVRIQNESNAKDKFYQAAKNEFQNGITSKKAPPPENRINRSTSDSPLPHQRPQQQPSHPSYPSSSHSAAVAVAADENSPQPTL